MLLACPCLNVKIYAKDLKPYSGRSTDFGCNSGDKELEESLAEVKLDNQGITIEHSYLVHREAYGKYKLFQCLSCKSKTHLVYNELNRDNEECILVNTKLESDPAVIERLKHSSNFSRPFGIILQKPSELGGNAPDPRNLDSLQTHLNQVQQQLSHFLLSEEQALEDRIRQYEEEQRADFQLVQDQAKADKRKMISIVLRASESTEDMSESMDCFSSHNEQSLQTSTPSKHKTRNKKRNEMRQSSQSFSGNRSYQNIDSEAMFMLDEVDPVDEPFYESDEGDDVSPIKSREDSGTRNRHNLYSSSVPISVPMWGKGRHHSTEDEEENDHDDTPSDHDQIADKMQALAESITDTGRYIFGDRPRPRMNTGEFIQKNMKN
ncbi:hypothetical protein SNE40_001709 [Patella caerulea]|uniref:Uncharacterized protein n=1 Tax=Patella caerulea TaxID=87958 RepID=A0AAN8PZ54_PATCE